ncbi:MAG: leucine-rich repeat protein [Ruminococcus sp.]|nr:leucine-rich repeat protein [Ruminococcus sp.]
MDKETLSHYGWIVILVLILSVLLAFASPFGTFIADGFKATYTGLFDVESGAMDVVMNATGGCTHRETEVTNVTADYSGDTVCKKCGLLMGTGKYLVPEGGTYTAVDGTVYGPGDEMPEVVTTGDKYQYGDYEYRYNEDYGARSGGWVVDESLNGWGVRYINRTKAVPNAILKTINNNPIVSLHATFRECIAVTTAPEIPDTVCDLSYTFYACSSLKTYNGSVATDGDFSAYIIPESVVNMYGSFGSTPLTKPPVIPQYVTNMANTFSQCSNLAEFPNIPNGVTNMRMTFFYCSSLTDATGVVIPASVTDIADCFQYCTSLTGTMKIDCNPEIYSYCFQMVDFKAQGFTLSGDSPLLDTLGKSGKNYCATCNGTCNGSH